MLPGDGKSTGTPSLLKNVATWLRQAKVVSSGFEGQRYLAKWLFLSVSIGIVAGLGAVVFFKSIGIFPRLDCGLHAAESRG